MTLKREIKDAYIEGGATIYVKTHGDAVYINENETETLTQRLDNVKDSITKHTSQLNAIANEVNQLSNPNLLINGDFQVWQRGNSFTNVSNGYTADRWKIYSEANVNVSKTDNGLKFKPNVDWGYLIYCFDDEIFNEIKGKNITLTIKTTKGIMSKAFSFKQGDDWLELGSVPNISCIFSYRNKNLQFLINAEVDIEYIKLEYGNIATPFVPRLYAEELALCRRYFERIGYNKSDILGDIGFNMPNSQILRTTLHYSSKRVSPTIKLSDLSNYRVYYKNTGVITASSINQIDISDIMDTCAVLELHPESPCNAQAYFQLQKDDNATSAWIDVDAEIY